MSSVNRGDASETPRTPAKITPADLATRGIFQILWRRQLILFLCVIICVVTAIVYITQATPIFESGSRIYINNNTPVILNNLITQSSSSANYLSTQCDVITSSPIIAAAVAKLSTQQMPSLANVENPIDYIRTSLTAEVGRTSDIITVKYDCPYADDAMKVVNEVVNSYIDNENQKRKSNAVNIVEILKKSYDKNMVDRTLKIQEIRKFTEEHPDITLLTDKGNVVLEKLTTLTDALVKEQENQIDAQTSWEAAKALQADPQATAQFMAMRAATGQGSGLQDLLSSQEAQQKVLIYQGYGTDSKPVKEILAQIDALKDRIKDAEARYIKAYVAVMEQNYVSSTAKLKILQKSYEETKAQAVTLGKNNAQLKSMQDDLASTDKFIEGIVNKIREIEVNNQDTTNINVQILEVAKAGGAPVKPKKIQVLLISVLVGLMMGFGAALLQDWMDQRLRSVDEISATLQLPILGVVPHITGGKTAMARGMEVHVEPMSEVSEAYRTIRTAVYFGVPEGEDNTVLVTSPAPGDGKTTMASNLAIAMAQAGHTVLLIDCDFRRPRQHRIFGLKDDVGLSSVLAGQHPLDEAVQATAVPNLSLLPCGPIPNNPSEILNSQVFADTIEELKGKFDHVVIDSPPVNPVTDARILAASADVTIIVVRADKSTRKLSENARESLLGVGANILGVVVNDAPRSGRGYGGYGYGYYSDRLYRDRTAKSGRVANAAPAKPADASADRA
jgi:capsular exopolysaccharide synthesis family protein